MPEPGESSSASLVGATVPVLALIRDLMFASRVRATAQELGVPLKLLRDPAGLAGEAGQRLIVDLNLEGAIDAAAAWRQQQGGRVVGFVSHVDTQTIQRARSAGIDTVMARSRFVEVLPELLRSELNN